MRREENLCRGIYLVTEYLIRKPTKISETLDEKLMSKFLRSD